ncbi:hypothetical protein [Candidatus Mycolicibacterium alkanivorans]|uniref:Transmembrane protein n=1 Tax=Candidatus Mycolicibacterium alkanivorans TaxID=2954114 RepID=A0ABS9YQQ4_9MYCO|nr:hypothetical protein [Candidatus Mycolicibacterium alkanivorans]MCI4673587.1 hypothetical protein [Candidatus Mycolicibacterium alkanivorans]
MTADETPSRPISVAELLAKNGTIGSPPVGGRRRRRRSNSDAVTVAELTGEIPIIRTGELPVVRTEATEDQQSEQEAAEETTAARPTIESRATNGSATAAPETPAEPAPAPQPFDVPPQRSEAPTPRRERGPERSHDPRPLRRPASAPAVASDSSDAEQMTFDPVDESAPELDLTSDEHVEEATELQSYLRSSGGTLFGGETVADDRARRGLAQENDDETGSVAAATAVDTEQEQRPRESKLTVLRRGTLVVLQSILAVAFGAGLFIAFDQLWQWNNIVALVLSVLVILGLVVAVRVVRKTEDIASTLIAVAVGALVTLGPLALLQST